MIIYINLICIIIFIIGNIIFVFQYKNLLITLLRLEIIVLSLYFFISIILSIENFNMYILIGFLVFRVCEGVLGLSILVLIIRRFGNDYFQRFNLL